MNSICQCLTYTIGLTNLMLDTGADGHRKVCKNKNNGFCGACFWESHIKQAFGNSKGALSPHQLFKSLRLVHSS